MNISFVLAVYNNIELTKNFYINLRKVYPSAKLVISDGGSTDNYKSWLESLNDKNLKYILSNKRISFSETYNNGIKLVDTDKLVLVHNDMIIGERFLENLENLLQPNLLLSYTTIEPPIFAGHNRPGKIINNFGSSFEDFNFEGFNNFIKEYNTKYSLYDGAVFFMSAYKNLFIDVGFFDEKNFFPCFCEDDDFLIRAKLKGYILKTTESAITYHFVSKTSRFSDEFINDRFKIEYNSNRNFIRKWGLPISSFNEMNYQTQNNFSFAKFKMGLNLLENDINLLYNLEPFFDKISCDNLLYQTFYKNEQINTNFNLIDKKKSLEDCDVIVIVSSNLTNEDFMNLTKLRLIIPNYNIGNYQVNNLKIIIKNKI
jgi:GT2 family glycosyltransferase